MSLTLPKVGRNQFMYLTKKNKQQKTNELFKKYKYVTRILNALIKVALKQIPTQNNFFLATRNIYLKF